MPALVDNRYNTTDAGQPIRPKADLDFIQTNAVSNVGVVIETLIGGSYDPTKSYVLKGCVLSSSGGTTSITEGIIYGKTTALGSMPSRALIYFVPAVSFADPVGPAVVLCNILPIPDATWDPTPFTDGSNHNIHIDYQLQFSSGTSGSGFVNYADLLFLFDLPYTSVSVSTAPGSGTVTGTVYYRKNYLDNTLTIYGSLISASSADFNDFPSTLYSDMGITLPVGFRPVASPQFFTGYYFLGSSIKNNAGDTYIDRFTCLVSTAGKLLIKWIKPDAGVAGYGINFNARISLH